MHTLAVVVGAVVVIAVLADMVNTLITTTTSHRRWWLTYQLYSISWRLVRRLAVRFPSHHRREQILGVYAPVSVLALLFIWVVQQIVGFGLIWWGLGGVDGAGSLLDYIYYSGVVYSTLGFGELLPTDTIPRLGALVEAFAGVLTTALVIGYLPSLYAAYSERERKLMTLDDGTEGRITPTNLLISRAPTGEIDDLLAFFAGWEEWVTGVIETHTAFPMLRLFRSKHEGQSWVTALGLICEASLQCQIIAGAQDRAPYWLLRRSIILFDELTENVNLAPYRERLDQRYLADHDDQLAQLYVDLQARGFVLVPYAEAQAITMPLRRKFDSALEYLMDELLAPRGFWGHSVGHHVDSMRDRSDLPPR